MTNMLNSNLFFTEDHDSLERFGFKVEGSGVHTRRTMMYKELSLLLKYVDDIDAPPKSYSRAINEDNCLGKRSASNRDFSAIYLRELYGLDPSITIFRLLCYFWQRDENARPLLALLCCFSRDALFRKSLDFILTYNPGELVLRSDLELYLNNLMPDHYSSISLASIAKNINSSWTQSGHLEGRARKYKVKLQPSTGAIAYALTLSYISGARGECMLSTDYMKLLECNESEVIELAEKASRQGLIMFKRIGNVIEINISNLLNQKERDWVYEQNRQPDKQL